MKEYSSILTEYAKEGYSMYSRTIPGSYWGNKALAESYLDKYWLSRAEYEEKWKIVQSRIFESAATGLSEMVFLPEFEIFVAKGGCLFVEEEFLRLQSCALSLGDKFIVIIENSFGGKLLEPTFRMKYPANITWQEITSGNFVSAIMLEMPHKDYFVFGESAMWGKYAANDHEIPLDLFGFKAAAEDVFKNFLASLEEVVVGSPKLPEAYKTLSPHRGSKSLL
jgi:hypothetical protein